MITLTFTSWRPGFLAPPLIDALCDGVSGMNRASAMQVVDQLLYDGKPFSVEVASVDSFESIEGIVFKVKR